MLCTSQQAQSRAARERHQIYTSASAAARGLDDSPFSRSPRLRLSAQPGLSFSWRWCRFVDALHSKRHFVELSERPLLARMSSTVRQYFRVYVDDVTQCSTTWTSSFVVTLVMRAVLGPQRAWLHGSREGEGCGVVFACEMHTLEGWLNICVGPAIGTSWRRALPRIKLKCEKGNMA